MSYGVLGTAAASPLHMPRESEQVNLVHAMHACLANIKSTWNQCEEPVIVYCILDGDIPKPASKKGRPCRF